MRRLTRRRERRDPNEMTLIEHLEELRYRLIIVAATLVVTSIVGILFFDPIFKVALGPYCRALEAIPPENRLLKGCALAFSSPVDPFLTRLKVGFFAGFLLALPIILWQLWAFIVPGLTQRERKLSIPFVLSSVALFAAGTVFAMLIIPRGLAFLFSFAGESLTVLLTVDKYLSFLIVLVLVFGLSFEFPLLLIFLAGARVVTSAQMKRWRRYTYFGLAVFAMIATPTQDPYSMLLLWVPLLAFYEAAIVVARILKR